ncbi:hypothetical protein FFWV33_15755 [Flavobacterium faecale]|uniref:Uncharacterized protein n=1 Tax=Flavobacterium faecale TaxID=1355330 RepID=A0A2S1LGI9_9FLAO|nr:hypothetical protein [Flavobacterium faecale]AWG22875.1 hypothetical protein FFWV33_15755 [Flavobacterium faecale]
MIEIYKTNVLKKKQAKEIAKKIKALFSNYKVNFDLEDCDCILRVDTSGGILDNNTIIEIFRENNFYIEILPDEVPILKI